MIETKAKPCKGINKAKGIIGCGEITIYRKYGLCSSCLSDFLFENDKGKLIMQKSILPKAKIKTESENKKKIREAKEKLKTPAEHSRVLQQVINSIAREIDKSCVCISNRKPIPKAQEQGGHFYSRSAYPDLRFNLHNIFLQSTHDNMYKSGNITGFIDGLSEEYGKDYCEYVQELKNSCKGLKLSIDEIKEATKKAREILKRLKDAGITHSAEQRIRLRTEYNKYIGIYLENNYEVYGK